MTLRELTPSVGVEVSGLDLSSALTTDEIALLARAWDAGGVLVFRGQSLTLNAQSAFACNFGPLLRTRAGSRAGSEFIYVGNVTVDGIAGEFPAGEMLFHHDGCYAPDPARASFLYAIEVPSKGGNTKFCSTTRAYRALPEALQREILSYDLLFTHQYGAVERASGHAEGPRYVHPLVIAHPRTGAPLLICNRLMADSIVGLPAGQSRVLIADLLHEMERPEHVYEHVWQPGDLVAWDNLAVQHARTDFDPGERRVLRRQQLAGTTLVAYRDVARHTQSDST